MIYILVKKQQQQQQQQQKKYDYSDEDRLSCKSFTNMLSNI